MRGKSLLMSQSLELVRCGRKVGHVIGVQDEQQSRLLAAQVLAMLMGWSLFEPFLVAAIGRNLDETTELRTQLSASALQMVTASVNR